MINLMSCIHLGLLLSMQCWWKIHLLQCSVLWLVKVSWSCKSTNHVLTWWRRAENYLNYLLVIKKTGSKRSTYVINNRSTQSSHTNGATLLMNKLTTILTTILGVFITGFSYGSRQQAREACLKWAARGITYLVLLPSEYEDTAIWCYENPSNKQIIGMENKAVVSGHWYISNEHVPLEKHEVK